MNNTTTKQNHKIWRKQFREGVLARDNNKCRVCNSEGILDAHHITDRHDFPNGGYVLSNGISLCSSCHIKAEKGFPDGFHPNDLYEMINSSYEKACEDSKKLSN